jgi:ribosomal protein S18 acetylase RimI-like enzyme
VPARVRAWPFDPAVAQLVVYRGVVAPTDDDIAMWLDELGRDTDFVTVRTGALLDAMAAPFTRAGFHEAQRLALLEHLDPAIGGAGTSRTRTRRLTAHQLWGAEAVDRAAFDAPWQLDTAAIDDACRATAQHRARVVRADRRVIGYAVTGRDGADGYLQRLAVEPAHQRQGVATALVLDALGWAATRGARRVLVNTHVHNERALALYRGLGFVDRVDQLVVLERSLR